jgi:two-component sensor histidine kinase
MVFLAQSSPGCRSTRSLQIKKATVMLGPYVGSRAIIQGSNVLLPPKYALTVALIIHELATNAAKYGSLSVPEGRVSFRSTISDRLLSLEWRENGGPLAAVSG